MLFAFLSILPLASAAGLFPRACSVITPKFAPTFASGYAGAVAVSGLTKPRGLIFDSAGNLLVVDVGVGVKYIPLQDNSGTSICAQSTKVIVPDTTLTHGIALSNDGKTLFVSSATTVTSYSYNAATGATSNKKTLIVGMHNSDHVTRTLMVSKFSPDELIVSIGSKSNLDAAAAQTYSNEAQIRTFSIKKATFSTQSYNMGGIVGWGLRNSVGIAENPSTHGFWSVENSADDLVRDTVDIHNTNPCEELNYHGKLGVRSAETGANFGYPTCFAAANPAIMPNNAKLVVGSNFALSSKSDSTCSKFLAPKLCFTAHQAPLSIRFKSDASAAYVTFHGSWDASPPVGYRLVKIPFGANGMPTAASTTLDGGAIDVMTNPTIGNCPNSCFRPVDLAFDKTGRLFMTSDATGEIWVITGA